MTEPQNTNASKSAARRQKHDGPRGVIIRAVEPEDAAGITALANLPGYRWGTMQLPYQSVSATREKMWAGGTGLVGLVAVQENEIIGQATLRRFEGRRSHVGAIGMGVHDACVGKGIGTALLSALIEVADDWWALRRVELTVFADNTRAIDLYERMGFEQEGRLRDYALRAGALVDAVSMARLRGPAPRS